MKKTIAILTVCALCIAGTFSAFASDAPNKEEIQKWEHESTMRSNPVADLDGIAPRAAKLVASDVGIEYSGFGDYGFAWGYTDVEDNGSEAFHYTKTQLRRTSNTKIYASAEESGYGEVRAETADVQGALNFDDAYGKVSWRTK